MNKFTITLLLISTIFTGKQLLAEDNLLEIIAIEKNEVKKIRFNARVRIKNAGTYHWKDSLRFLPTFTMSRRAPYDQYGESTTETYFSASISFNQFFDMADIADKKLSEKRKAIRKVESLAFNIEKLIDRKYLLIDQIWKMKKIVKSIEDPLEAANRQEKIDGLEVKKNEAFIEIEKLFAEIEYLCVEVER